MLGAILIAFMILPSAFTGFANAYTSYSLTIQSPTGSGSTSPGTGARTYQSGTSIKVTAYPSSSYKFDHWIKDGANAGSSNPISFTMSSSHTLKAVFTQTTTYSLTIQSPSGSGSTSPATSTHSYTFGTSIKVTAYPSSSYKFDHWIKDGANAGSSNPISFTMSSSHTLKAVFTQTTTYSLTIQSPSGSGSTTPTAGSSSYASGSIVQVTATPSSGWQFSHWHLDGADSGSTSPTTVTMNSAHTISAVFTQIPSGLTSYRVYRTGSTYYAQNQATKAITSNVIFVSLFDSIKASNTQMVFADGVYEVTTQTGLVTVNGMNMELIGSSTVGGTVFKETYAATTALPVKEIFDLYNPGGTTSNILISNITFDGNEATYPNSTRPTGLGSAWLCRVGGSNIKLEGCRFINAPDCGVVVGSVNRLYVTNIYFNDIGEHPFYFSSSPQNILINGMTLLNWGKWVRGYALKITDHLSNMTLENFYFEPNQDGKGYKESISGTGCGAYGPVIASYVTGVTIKNGKIVDNTSPALNYMQKTVYPAIIVEDHCSDIVIENVTFENFNNVEFLGNSTSTPQTAAYAATLINCTFKKMTCYNFPWIMQNCTWTGLPTSIYFEDSVSGSTVRNVKFIRDGLDASPRLLWIGRGVVTTGVTVDGCTFNGYGSCGVDMTYAVDSTIENCVFSGGYSVWGINAGGTRCIIQSNTFLGDTTYGTVAIYCNSGSGNRILNNVINAKLHNSLTSGYIH